MKKILIIYGYKKREYAYLLLFKKFLKKRGFDVKIKYMNFECYSMVNAWHPDFVVLNQVNQNENIAFARYSRKCGARIIILNAELLYSIERIKIKYAPGCNEFVDYTIEAGDKEKFNLIYAYSHLDKSKIRMLGTPKLDVYLPVVRRHMKIHKPYKGLLPAGRKVICICTSFSHTNVSWDKVKHNVAYQQIGQKKLDVMVRAHRMQRLQYIALAKKLAKTNRCTVIFRVHPLEDPRLYKEELHGIPNIILDNTVHQYELFEVADLLIHRSSTMAIEAWMRNIQTVCFDPIDSSDMKLFPFTRFERIFHSQSSLIRYIAEFVKGGDRNRWEKERKAYLKRELGFSVHAKISASQRISAFLSTIPVIDKRRVYHPFVLIFAILNILRRMTGKKHIYDVIAMVKGSEYKRIYKENYV